MNSGRLPGVPDPAVSDPAVSDPVPEQGPEDDVLPDIDSIRMRQELRRRIRSEELADPAGPRSPLSGGRHARRGPDGISSPRRPRLDYVPRHSVSTPGPGAVSAHAVTERFSRPGIEPSGEVRPHPPEPGTTDGSAEPGVNGVTGSGTTGTGVTGTGGTGAATESGVAPNGTTVWSRPDPIPPLPAPSIPAPPLPMPSPPEPPPSGRGRASIGPLQPPSVPLPSREPGPGADVGRPTTWVNGTHGMRIPPPGTADRTDEDEDTQIIDLTAATSDTETILTRGSADRPADEHAEPAGVWPPYEEVEGSDEPAEEPPPGKRVRVVLSQRKGTPPRPVRTVVDVQELTQVGELLSTSLIRSQLSLALRFGGIAAIALGAWPAVFILFPVLGRVELFGLRLPWLILGVLAYPFMLGLGYLYARSAEKLEQVFVQHIQN